MAGGGTGVGAGVRRFVEGTVEKLKSIFSGRTDAGIGEDAEVEGEAGRWVEQARRDRGAAAVLLREGYEEHALFHLHQAVEKALKAVQILQEGTYHRTHRLQRLAGRVGLPDRFDGTLQQLDPAYTAVRYPDTVDITVGDADALAEAVGEVIEWTRKQ